ncbi:P-loop containing nucleoside triphosphate hydrolase protein [Daedalea quercina L-15889]|uniref:RNA helicase n=1 Tax=Daedalea quercina L-15889 TaxID=1314783 RepID=A0A165SXV5_9APHY|nr:P-loop containing nucleoside triphosphate hydrolase protein [Daedalea quercina L-15889]
MRAWSAGNLDIPMRPTDPPAGPVGRQDSIFRGDKRRSVSNLLRRDSAGGESLANVSTSREGGPVITKWEQLNLASDLLRSLNTFGVGPPNKIQQRALPFLLRGSDIIAQAPPTQERIAAYVIPAIHIALTNWNARNVLRGPIVVMVSTTVDQATQAQRMIRDLGGPIGIKSALGVGATGAGTDLSQELRILQQNMPHIICGTPQKLHALFTTPGGLSGLEVRFLVLDEVDQLIARNLHEFVFNIIKQLPPPRSRAPMGGAGTPATTPGSGSQSAFGPLESIGGSSLTANVPNLNRRLSAIGMRSSPPIELANGSHSAAIERQTALFSNTVPQDVLNLASAIQLREPVRVLVRRDGNVTHADTSQGARGLRQFYLYLAFTASGRSDAPLPAGGLGIIGSGRGATSAETAQAREWKLDALTDLFDDLDIPQAIIHVGGMNALDAVVYKLASRGLEAVPLHGDMNAGAKLAALNKFRSPPTGLMRQPTTKVLVVYDVQVKTPEVSQIPLIINYDLPKAVEEYAHRVAPAIAPSYSRAGVVVNFVTATGGDVEMLRSIECFYKIKCPEVPMSLRDIV